LYPCDTTPISDFCCDSGNVWYGCCSDTSNYLNIPVPDASITYVGWTTPDVDLAGQTTTTTVTTTATTTVTTTVTISNAPGTVQVTQTSFSAILFTQTAISVVLVDVPLTLEITDTLTTTVSDTPLTVEITETLTTTASSESVTLAISQVFSTAVPGGGGQASSGSSRHDSCHSLFTGTNVVMSIAGVFLMIAIVVL